MGYEPRGGNATVPNDAVILPAQAFVNNIAKFLNGDATVNVVNQGITYIDTASLIPVWLTFKDLVGSQTLVAAENALNQTTVDALFSLMGAVQSRSLDTSGGTSATPTGGAANPGAWTIVTGGSTGDSYFNLHGRVISLVGDGSTPCDFSGNSMPASEVNALLAFLVANHLTTPYPLTLLLTGGTNAAPTGQGIVDKATLITNGWTVTTN